MADNTTELILAVKAQTEQLNKLTKEVGQLTGGLRDTQKQSEETGVSFEKFVKVAGDIVQVVGGVKDLALGLKDTAAAAFELVKGVAEEDRALTNLSKTLGISREA